LALRDGRLAKPVFNLKILVFGERGFFGEVQT